MNLGEIFDFVLFIITKEQTGWFSPEEVIGAVNNASIDVFNEYKPMYGKDADATAALAPFKNTYDIVPNNSHLGVVTLPSDPRFVKLLSFLAIGYDNTRQQTTYTGIDVVSDDELPNRLSSQLVPVTVVKPIATTIGDGKFQLWPKQGNTAQVSYLRMPVPARMAYAAGSGTIVYLPNISQELEWSPVYHLKIIAKAVGAYLGINIDDSTLTNYFTQKSKEAA